MDLPKVIYVGAADYDVKHVKKLDLLGETDNVNTTISIKRSQSDACKRDTVLHEALHAIVFCSGASYKLTHEKEEKLVRVLALWILALIRDNPELIAYLTEGLDG